VGKARRRKEVFFFEKRTKKLLSVGFGARVSDEAPGDKSARAKVFWFFFSKKNTSFLAYDRRS
jgi:hypothetical protein